MKKFLALALSLDRRSVGAARAQNPDAGAPRRRMVQGGSGPVRMLLITKRTL